MVFESSVRPEPYPPIEQHGVIGDRRTAALVSSDGTIDWLCLPDYGSPPIFGALLDSDRGGSWRFGPAVPIAGTQRYRNVGATLTTQWITPGADLVLTDAMAWNPASDPQSVVMRAIVRRLTSIRGEADVTLSFRPRDDFDGRPDIESTGNGLILRCGSRALGFWCNRPVSWDEQAIKLDLRLGEGDECWSVLVPGGIDGSWSVDRARSILDETDRAWTRWVKNLSYMGPRADRVRRSAVTVHLLSDESTGSLVAAPTNSLPERIGGSKNYDYRYAWVRDASLSLASLAMLGDRESPRRYMDWLAGLGSSTGAPLQVMYGLDGRTDLTERTREDLNGYRGSKPVRVGNHAYSQDQLDSMGYYNDCSLIYLQQGGPWREEYWKLNHRISEHVAATWREPDHGIWELSARRHYVSSKVMAWVALKRATEIADHLGRPEEAAPWKPLMNEIHADVMTHGWSDSLGAFRQHYGTDTLDASVLLIPVMGFLPADHPRVLATVDRIVERLTINGFVHRFRPTAELGLEEQSIGEFEGAFLPCTFWLATTYAKAGRPDLAEAILERAEAVAGELGLFSEEVDARSGAMLGNHPLLFSQVEYVRAVLETAKARPLGRARLMLGKAAQILGWLFGMGDAGR